MDLRLQVKHFILRENLIQEGDHVLVGFSGGADSLCLLEVLKSLSASLSFTVGAVHVHHGIRGEEADRDAAFCSTLCCREKIPFRLMRCDVPGAARASGRSIEETARDLRYLLLRQAAREITDLHRETRVKVAVAHHMDDQAETLLFNLCRGTGLKGLCGMSPEKDGVIRPLLGCRRREIEEWLKIKGYEWVEDGTNESDAYTRNHIRHLLLPELLAVNTRSVEHLAFIAGQARQWDDFLQGQAEAWLADLPEGRGSLTLPAGPLAALPQALRTRILHIGIARVLGGSRDIGGRHILAAESLLFSGAGAEIRLPGGWRILREYEVLRFVKDEAFLKKHEEPEILPVRADIMVFPRGKNQKIPEKQYTKWFDYDKIGEPVSFRTRKPGDSLTLAGVGTKAVQRYMIDAHIPERERDRIPLLVSGSQVLWIVGYRMNAAFQVTEETQTILQVTVYPDRS